MDQGKEQVGAFSIPNTVDFSWLNRKQYSFAEGSTDPYVNIFNEKIEYDISYEQWKKRFNLKDDSDK